MKKGVPKSVLRNEQDLDVDKPKNSSKKIVVGSKITEGRLTEITTTEISLQQ